MIKDVTLIIKVTCLLFVFLQVFYDLMREIRSRKMYASRQNNGKQKQKKEGRKKKCVILQNIQVLSSLNICALFSFIFLNQLYFIYLVFNFVLESIFPKHFCKSLIFVSCKFQQRKWHSVKIKISFVQNCMSYHSLQLFS